MQLTSSAAGASLESLSTGAGRNLTTKGLASGIKLGDEAILHLGLFTDIGYDTNVFFGDKENTSSAPVLHITPRLEISNATRDGSQPTEAYYNVAGSVNIVRYLVGSDREEVSGQDAVNPSIGGTVEFHSGQQLSFTLSESFGRFQQAPYVRSTNVLTRDDNMASASLLFAPGGGRLRLMLRYSNLVDYYEKDFNRGSNMGNEGVLDLSWRWLPRTSLYVKAAFGVITYFNQGGGVSSHPLRTMAGLRGLLTEKLSLNLGAGYNNAFYSSGGNPTGFGNVGIVAEISYYMSLLSRVGIGYHHDFVNSPFVGQYYDLDAIYFAYQQIVASRLVTYLNGRYENRRYGIESRRDDTTTLGIAIDYMIGNFLIAGASYSLSLNRTNDHFGDVPGIDYTKHVFLFRLGVMY
jgi:hypothetical protein